MASDPQDGGPRPALAVVGLSALFPGSQDAAGFWRDILAGRDLLSDVPESHWLVEDYYDPDPQAPDKTYARRGGFLSPIEFDPLEHGVPPNVVPATDSSQLLALIAAKQVLDDAIAGQFDHVDRERTSIILGVTSAQELLVEMGARLQRPVWVKALREHGLPEPEVQRVCDAIAASYVPWQENTFPGLLGNVVAGRIANRLNLGGTNCVTDAACASSFSALQMGANELLLGQSDMVIVGGVETFNDIFMFMCFSKTPALSRSGDCRPFAKAADGTMLGEGIAMLALRRLADAERDGDRIYAVVRGIGSSSDGRSKSIYAPVAEGQAKALRRAYAAARYSPATVELMEAHGTGTKAGDAAEFEGMRQVFDETGRKDRQWCALGSVKSQVGHTKATAGAAGLFKIVMALHHKVLPPTIKVDEPLPSLAIESTPFHLNTRARPWIRGSEHPRRASVSSFGFGGSNFHVTAEEYRGAGAPALRTPAWPAELVLASAATPGALVERLGELSGQASSEGALGAIARFSHDSFDAALPARIAIVASDEGDLRRKAEAAAASIRDAAERPFSTPGGVHYALGAQPGRIALLFPGQGSQSLEMGADVAMSFDVARAVWDRAADAPLEPPLHDVVFPRPTFSQAEREAMERQLTATEWAQPAIGVASAALLAVLRRAGVQPDALAGHSFGEVTALHAAGALDIDSFLRVARRRGELMAEAARQKGAMLAVAGAPEAIRALARDLDAGVVVANHNSPRQVVLSGPSEAIDRTAERLGESGLQVRRLAVATAFHSPLVATSSEPFAEFLRGVLVSPPAVPVFSNALAAPYAGGPDDVRRQLASQIARPVRFAEMIDALHAGGVRTFIEVGPGAVLSGLVGECLADRPHAAISLDRKGQHGVLALWNALGRMAVQGVRVDLGALLAGFKRPRDPRARKQPALSLRISGANYAKPYPPPGGASALPQPNPERPAEQPAPMAHPAPPSTAPPADWALAYQEVQRQTAAAHESYLRTMAETHAAFLRTAEASLAALQAALGGQATVPPPQPAAVPLAPLPMMAPAPVLPLVAAAPPAPAPQPPPPVAQRVSPAAAVPRDLPGLLMSVVAEKTGYPADMLSLEMDLESDLGVDSIKRVEILAAMQERASGLPEVKAAQMASLRTLGQVVEFLGGAAEPAVPMATAARAATTPAPAVARGNGELNATLLAVVAEKTGYPADMLSLEMELEGDLGIDSIKRVEILAAMQERVPGLPEVKAAELAALRTLGQIVARMHGEPAAGRAEPRQQPAPAAPEPARLAVVERPAPALGASLPGLFTVGPLAITDDGGGVAPELARLLGERGLHASVVRELPAGSRAVVCLDGLAPLGSVDEAIAVNRRVFAAARALAPLASQPGAVFVTVQDTGGDFGLAGSEPIAAWSAGLAALAKTAALEWPGAGVRAIDVERAGRSSEAVAAALAEELLAGGPELEVGLRADGGRTAPALEAGTPLADQAPIDERSVIVASGGARGVTAACLIELARQSRPSIALLGRTTLEPEPAFLKGIRGEAELGERWLAELRGKGQTPSPAELRARVQATLAAREVRATLAALAEAGSRALYLSADVQSASAVAAAVAEARRTLGPITALVHGAGVIADKRIGEKTDEQWARVFDTKVQGLRALLAAVAEDPIAMVCVFSSVAGRFGNEGQADYAMANEVASKVAAAEARRRGCAAKALHWGPWDGGMVDAGLKAHFAARGVELLPLESGARRFVSELGDARAREVVIGAAPAARPRQAALEFHVGAATHPFLDGHRIDGTPVLPVALALEWLARAAAACRPDLTLVELSDVRVQRGIRLARYGDAGDAFRVSSRETANGDEARLLLEIRAQDGTLHYSASALMAAELKAPPAAPPRAPIEPAPWPVSRLYPELLFHGEGFRAVRSLGGVSARAGEAVLLGVAALGWTGAGAWRLDPAAIDGALQLAILLGHLALGGPSLPTRIGRLQLFQKGPAEGEVSCRIEARDVSPLRTLSELWLSDRSGRPLAVLSDLEMHARPEKPQPSESERAQPALS
jgi:malonyl CoA-acyl carrier protein transacylase